MRHRVPLLLWLLMVYLAVCSGAAIFLAHVTLHPLRRPVTAADKTEMREIAGKLSAQVEDVSMVASDGATLRAWHIRSKHGNGDSVLLLHGLGDNRMGTTGYAELLLAHGYDVLMPDARAHGNSGGRIATYGVIERNDIRQWFDWLEAKEQVRCIFGFAESMGAAQLLESLGVQPN